MTASTISQDAAFSATKASIAISKQEAVDKRGLPKNTPILERDMNKEELVAELRGMIKIRKVIIGAVWTIAAIVMIYGIVNVTPFVIHQGISPWIAFLLPLVVDAGLCVALWGDRVLRRYSMTDHWVTALRWITGLLTLALNTTEPFLNLDANGVSQGTDWVSVGVHSVGPIMLILVTEAANSFSRKITRIVQVLTQIEGAQEQAASDERKRINELQRQATELAQENHSLKAQTEKFDQEIKDQSEKFESSKEKREEQINALLTERQNLAMAMSGEYPLKSMSKLGSDVIGRVKGRTGKTILSVDTTTGREITDQYGHRLIVVSHSDVAITVADAAHKAVNEAFADAKTGNASITEAVANIPPANLITLRDSDIGAAVIDIFTDSEGLDVSVGEHRDSYVEAIASMKASNFDESESARIVIRAGLATGRLKASYGRPPASK